MILIELAWFVEFGWSGCCERRGDGSKGVVRIGLRRMKVGWRIGRRKRIYRFFCRVRKNPVVSRSSVDKILLT
jgi:hypothetical protein